MTYQDLNLKKIREDNGLDFAHFTFLPGMCTCCYDPLDFPARYWRKGIKPGSMDNVQYLLFKNADNGAGAVKKRDEIKGPVFVLWRFPEEKMRQVCSDLQTQLGKEYIVLMPPDEDCCILIVTAAQTTRLSQALEDGYTAATWTPTSADKFAEKIQQIIQEEGKDYEMAHVRLDELLCQVLEENGYGKGVALYRETPKW